MKKCNKCGLEKELTEFRKDPARKDGHRGICLVCFREQTKLNIEKLRSRKYLPEIKEKKCCYCKELKSINNFDKNYSRYDNYSTGCKSCRAKRLKHKKQKLIQNQDYIIPIEKKCNHCLITKPIYDFHIDKNHITKHATCCKKCHKEKNKNNRFSRYKDFSKEQYEEMYKQQNGKCSLCNKMYIQLHIDHCHSTGIVRGLLCSSCNSALGKFGDNIEGLQKAIDYIKKSECIYKQTSSSILDEDVLYSFNG